MSLRLKKRGEKALESALGRVVPDEDLVRSGTLRRKARSAEEDTISEADEQSSLSAPSTSRLHRRETAESGQWQ